MAQKITMPFKKGDRNVHYFLLPEDQYTVGGVLSFAAKPAPDNDASDAAAVIDKQFGDDVVDLVSNPGFALFTLEFEPNDIVGVNYTNGAKVIKYMGEFQYVPNGGQPISWPGDDDFIVVPIYADIKRGT